MKLLSYTYAANVQRCLVNRIETRTSRASFIDLVHSAPTMSMSQDRLSLAGGSFGDPAVFGIVTVSDRASAGVYDDASGPAILGFFHEAIKSKYVRSAC